MYDKKAILMFAVTMSDRVKHLARFWWQLHSPSTDPNSAPLSTHASPVKKTYFNVKSHKLFYMPQVLKLPCQAPEIASLLCNQRRVWIMHSHTGQIHIAMNYYKQSQVWHPGLQQVGLFGDEWCVPGEGLASWPVNRPERVPVRPQVRFFLPEPATRGEEAKSYLWREVPAAGDLRVLLQKRPHLGVQRLADAPMAAALPAQRGASPPAPPSLGKGALPAQEKEPLPAAQGHVSPRTNPPQESSEHSLSDEHSRGWGRRLKTNSHDVVFHSDGRYTTDNSWKENNAT